MYGCVSAQETLAAPSLDADYCCWNRPEPVKPDISCAPAEQGRECVAELGLLKKGEVANPVFLEDCFGLLKGWTSPQESRPAMELLGQGEKSSETL